MNKIAIPDVECLHCKRKGACITDSDSIETIEDIIIRPVICSACGKAWKDFYGDKNADSVLISIQRNSSNDNDKSDKLESNDKLSEQK